MSLPNLLPEHVNSPSDRVREELARGDAAIARIGPILDHLLATPDHSLFSDEIVARVRGMLHDLAGQMLRAQAEATGEAAREEFAQRHRDALAAQLQGCTALLGHVHALAIEWQLTTKMETQVAVDPVLSPLVQDLIASPAPATASAAMAVLASQARFAQAQRRMELPLVELPGDLLHAALIAWRSYTGNERSDAIARADAKMRNSYDEGAGRTALLARLIAGLGDDSSESLMPDRAGIPLFLTALALRSGQKRELAVLSTNEQQIARLALGLRVAGLTDATAQAVVIMLHPEGAPLQEIGSIDLADARQMLGNTRKSERR